MNFVSLFGLAKKLLRIAELRFKFVPYFGSDLITTTANAWADYGLQIGGAGTEMLAHFANALFHDALNRPAPSGVEHADGSTFRIDEDDRKTIRSECRKQNPRGTRDQTITGKGLIGNFGNAMNDVRMNLA